MQAGQIVNAGNYFHIPLLETSPMDLILPKLQAIISAEIPIFPPIALNDGNNRRT